jgi:hypothetical protein
VKGTSFPEDSLRFTLDDRSDDHGRAGHRGRRGVGLPAPSTAVRGVTELESGLGPPHHESESRILRQLLDRGTAPA